MKRQSKYKLICSLLVASGVIFFQNCSQVVTQRGPTSNDQKGQGQGVSGGTTTDNPMTSSLKVSFAKFRSDTQTSLCVGGSQFAGTPAAKTLGKDSKDGKDLVQARSTHYDHHHHFENDGDDRRPSGFFPMPTLPGENSDASAATQDLATLANFMNNPIAVSQLSPEGTTLGQEQLRPGVYNQMVIHLNGGCPSGASVTVTNDKGTFTSSEPIDLMFAGDLTVEPGAHEVNLDVSRHLRLLDKIESPDQIKRALESIVGRMQ